MQITKAIEVLTIWKKENCPPPLADEFNALQLGIEALKRIVVLRTRPNREPLKSLPGETKEAAILWPLEAPPDQRGRDTGKGWGPTGNDLG